MLYRSILLVGICPSVGSFAHVCAWAGVVMSVAGFFWSFLIILTLGAVGPILTTVSSYLSRFQLTKLLNGGNLGVKRVAHYY